MKASQKKLLKKDNRIAVWFSDEKFYVGSIKKADDSTISVLFDDESKRKLKIAEIDIYDGLMPENKYGKGLSAAGIEKYLEKYGSPSPSKNDKNSDSDSDSDSSEESEFVPAECKKGDLVVTKIGENFFTGTIEKFLNKKELVSVNLDAVECTTLIETSKLIGIASKARKRPVPEDKLELVLNGSASSYDPISELSGLISALPKKQMKDLLTRTEARSKKFADVVEKH